MAKINAIEKLKTAMATDIMNLAIGDTGSLSDIAQGAISGLSTEISDVGDEAEDATGDLLGFSAAVSTAISAGMRGKTTDQDVTEFLAQATAIGQAYENIAGVISSINISSAGSSSSGSSDEVDVLEELNEAFEEYLKNKEHEI